MSVLGHPDIVGALLRGTAGKVSSKFTFAIWFYCKSRATHAKQSIRMVQYNSEKYVFWKLGEAFSFMMASWTTFDLIHLLRKVMNALLRDRTSALGICMQHIQDKM